MTTVVDLGCYDHNGQYPSLTVLADWYQPDIIYGFDPDPHMPLTRKTNGIPTRLQHKAAWTYNGTINYQRGLVHGREGTIGVGPYVDRTTYIGGRLGMIGIGSETTPCFDFSEWLQKHGPAIVKIDIEGAEYGLLHHMLEQGTLPLIQELLIEWHFHKDQEILDALTCPVKEWLY